MNPRFQFFGLFFLLTPFIGWAQTARPQPAGPHSAGPQPAKPVRVTGSLNLYAGAYAASGIEARNQPSPFGLNGAVTVSLPGGVSLPFSATLGNQGSAFRQPFNQFGVSPTYKWVTAHAGYRNVSFSPFTLAGHTFLGGGVELNPGRLRLGVVYGRFNKAIESNLADPNLVPAFRRTGYAVKLGYGTASNYFDVVLLRAADDTASVRLGAGERRVAPAENAVVGVTSRLNWGERKFFLELDGAVSAYARDTRAAAVNVEGTGPGRLFVRLFTPRLSSQVTTAVQVGLGYRGKVAGLKLQYKRVEPNFLTMGAYYFQSDIESYAVAPSLNLLGGKLRLLGSLGLQRDNLARHKAARTGRTIGSLTLAYNPVPRFGLDLQLTNYGISQQAGLRPVIDTLKLAQNNFSALANLRYSAQSTLFSHTVTLTAQRQQLQDLNPRTAGFTENQNTFLSLGYYAQQLEQGVGANLSGSYTQTSPAQGAVLRFFGPSAGLNVATLNRVLTADLTGSYLFNRQDSLRGKVINAALTVGYLLAPRHRVSLLGNYLNSDTGLAEQRFHEWRGAVGYTLTFGN